MNLSEEDWALGCLLVFSWGLSRALIGSEDESPVETLEKALGHHFISKMGLTCL